MRDAVFSIEPEPEKIKQLCNRLLIYYYITTKKSTKNTVGIKYKCKLLSTRKEESYCKVIGQGTLFRRVWVIKRKR